MPTTPGSDQRKPRRELRPRSMTGYGSAAKTDPYGWVLAEVRSVNGRYLKLTTKLPPRYGGLEERIRALLPRCGIFRGSVEVGLYLSESGVGPVQLNTQLLRRYTRQVRALARALRFKAEPPLEALLALPGVVSQPEGALDLSRAWKRCGPVLAQALAQLDAMRAKEGAALVASLRDCLKTFRARTASLRRIASASKDKAGAKFRERVNKALAAAGVPSSVPSDSLARELVILADRLDTSEELTRLDSHLAQMEALLAGGGQAGRKLDFLCQELFRELNTLGSKAQDHEISHEVVELKDLAEKMREQVQNLE